MNKTCAIIVPVYNTEKYISRCLDSIISQTYKELEIIVVNDGSVDGSEDIVKRFCEKDERIKYIYKENGGAASARNLGLDSIQNSLYVTFVDSDDYIHEDYIKRLVYVMEQTDSDVSVCGYRRENRNIFCDEKESVTVYGKSEIGKEIFVNRTVGLYTFSKLFKSDMVKNLRFLNGRINEDDLFMTELFSKSNKTAVLRAPLYYYTVNENGVTYSKYDKRQIDILPISLGKLAIVEKTWNDILDNAIYIAACSFIDLHIEYVRRKLGNEFKEKLIKDREEIYNYFSSHTERTTKLINKKVDFYYKNIGKIMIRDKLRFLRYDIEATARKFAKKILK